MPFLFAEVSDNLNLNLGMALVGAGTMSYYAKQIAAGQPVEPPESGKFAMEVVDKSNLLGGPPNTFFPALWFAGNDSLSRWSDQDAAETIGGPTAGTLAAIYERRFPSRIKNYGESAAVMDTVGPQFNRADLHSLRRLAPGQNHWLFRNAIIHVEDSIGDAFNLQGTSNKGRAEANAQ